jgi:AcrR family transcriptional regulator
MFARMGDTQSARTDATRRKLLEAGFGEVFRRGFQATSLNDIATAAGVTKGALFHHFDGKQALGYAILDDVLAPVLHQRWLAPLAAHDDPIAALQESFRRHVGDDVESGNWTYGCPMNNLAQEMSTVDDGFRTRLAAMYAAWRAAIAAALRRGQRAGRVRRDVDTRAAATLVVFSQMGIWGTGKYSETPQLMQEAAEALCAYLETLRP